jgi:hypothetical protein
MEAERMETEFVQVEPVDAGPARGDARGAPVDAEAAAGSPLAAAAVATARAYAALTLASLRANVHRPASLAVRGLGSALVALCEAIGMVLLVDRFGSIAGWSTPQIIVLAGLVFTGQGSRWRRATGCAPTTSRY